MQNEIDYILFETHWVQQRIHVLTTALKGKVKVTFIFDIQFKLQLWC